MNINLTNLSVILPDSGRRLFRIKSLKIASGEKVLVQGPSGRGKTTLLHIIAGLLMPDEGHVEIEGVKYRYLSETQRSRFRRKNLAIIFQKLNLLNHLTSCENLLLGASRPGFTRREA